MKQLSPFAVAAGLILPLTPLAPARAAGFSAPETWIDDFSVRAGWRVGRHPRLLGDVDGDGLADVVGFGETGVIVSRSNGTRFAEPELWVSNYSFNQGWRVDRHPRFLADVDDDGRVDIVGFGEDGVYVSRSTGAGFRPPSLWLREYSASHGWRVDRHPRSLADVDGDDRPDIIGFGDAGVYVSTARGPSFSAPALWVDDFGHDHGWRVDRHLRLLADVDADHRADVVGFGELGVTVARASGDRFTAPKLWVDDYGHTAGGWRVERHPRLLADVSGDGKADIIGFGETGTLVSLARARRFGAPRRLIADFGHDQGWRSAHHLRFAGDIDGDDLADVIGFGDDGVYVATSRGASFRAPVRAVSDFGRRQGWRVDTHVRVLADVNGDGLQDLVGFGEHGTVVALAGP